MDDALAAREARYRLLVDHAPVSLYVHDGTTILFANRSFAKLLGHGAPDELVGRPLFDLLPADLHDSVRARIDSLPTQTRDGFNAPFLGRLVRRDGSIVHVEVVAAATEFEGRPAIQVVALDVSDRVLAEQAIRERDAALRRSEAQLSQAQRIAKLGSWESNLLDHELLWSDELYRIFELDRAHAPARRDTWLAVVHPDDRAGVIAAYETSVATRTPAVLSYRLRMADGRIKHLHQHVETEYDDAGRPFRSLGTVQDVTEQVQAAAERVLLEAQLQHAQRIDALGTLAAGIAHDFNNILTAIMANAAFATREVGPSHPARESLAAISTAGARAADLVSQILAVGRRQPHQVCVVAISTILGEALQLLRATIPTGVEITTDIAADTPCISADPTQLHQVVMNLCTNAWHAMEGRGGRIDIRTSRVTLETDADAARLDSELRPGRYARITISDTGAGMDPAILARIFDPFFTTKPVGGGSGLGLSVVHGIVKGHDGVVTVASSPGHGTTFQLYFPAVDAPAEQAARSSPRPARASELQRRVLLIDDEAAIVRVFTRELTELGFQVTSFTRPLEALEVMRATAFDVVVTDHRMPELSGFDLAREIRRMKLDVPIVMMSGHLSDELLGEGASVGISRFLGKPCSVEQIAELLEGMTS